MGVLGQISRFGFVGVAATIVHVATGLTLHNGLGVAAFWANLVAFGIAVGVNFIGQTRLTFPHAAADGPAFLRFATVGATGLALNQTIVWVVTSALDAPYWMALAIIVLTVPWLTFALLKLWALRR